MAAAPEVKKALCCRGHEAPKLGFVLDCFSLKESNVLRVVVVGSHLWGTCTSKSDWDTVIVTARGKDGGVKGAKNAHKGNIDAWIVTEDEYNTYISEHLIQALLTVWVPDGLVLMKKPDFDPVKKFHFSSSSMKAAVNKLYERDTRVAGKHFSKGHSNGGIKIVKHLLRQLELVGQIIDSGSINNYTVSLDLSTINGSWEDIERLLLCKKDSILN